MNTTTRYLSALAGDIAAAFKIPGTGVLSTSIQDMFERRLAGAREILIDEIKRGDKDVYEAHEVDEVAAITYRYMRAAQEGTARLNLRLMAQVIAGQKSCNALKSDDFLYYADIISALRREEVILLGYMYKFLKEEIAKEGTPTPAYSAQERAKRELIPHIFATPEDFTATIGAVMRTGLVIGQSAYGGMVYQVSPLMDKLSKLASFEDALARET